MPAILTLEEVRRNRHQLVLNYRVDDIVFSTVYWYQSVDFFALETRLGQAFMRKVYFHLLAYEANKAASLKPHTFDPGPYADLCTDTFFYTWSTIFYHVWAVWRYENDMPDYEGPQAIQGPIRECRHIPAVHLREQGSAKLLSLCGGGKDSLAAARLLEGANIPYDVMIYSHNIYGQAQRQHDLIDGMLQHTHAGDRHRAWVFDDALDSPAPLLYPQYGVKRMLAAETVSSYWTALPIALMHDYTQVALGVTRSTDEHNLIWERTGEEINYLWGMSREAETLLHDYIKAEIAHNLDYFHVLRSIYDVTVFSILMDQENAVSSTHSCAQQKPWCCRCPKCLYVWMHLNAYLDADAIADMFGVNLFDLPENGGILRKMLGMEGYKPYDCVGTVSETQIAYLLCRAKGISGQILEGITPLAIAPELETFLATYAQVYPAAGSIPADIYRRIHPQMQQAAMRARAYIRSHLHADGA